MLLGMAVVALLVFDWLGLDLLRRAWMSVDRLWTGGSSAREHSHC